MNSVERTKAVCKDRKIPISRLEKELGYANGYIGQLRKGVLPDNRLVEIAAYLDVSVDYLLGKTDNPKGYAAGYDMSQSLDVGDPLTGLFGLRVLASVKAGYGGYAYEEDTGRAVPVSAEWLHGYEAQECRAMLVRGNSMYPTLHDGDIVIVHCQPEVENGEVAVCIVNGEEGTVKRVYKIGDRVELRADNPQVPPTKLSGQQLEDFHVYGKVIRLMRDDI